MTRTITISPAYYVPAKTLKLEDGEEVCPECRGEGEIVWMYRDPVGPNEMGICWTCHGSGKLRTCELCGKQYGAAEFIKHNLCDACFWERVQNRHGGVA